MPRSTFWEFELRLFVWAIPSIVVGFLVIEKVLGSEILSGADFLILGIVYFAIIIPGALFYLNPIAKKYAQEVRERKRLQRNPK